MGPGRSRQKFTKEFKIEAVHLSRQPGMTVSRVARDLGIRMNVLYRWRQELAEAGDEAFRGHGRMRTAEEELARLRRENAELRMERDILKKAAAYFARHTS